MMMGGEEVGEEDVDEVIVVEIDIIRTATTVIAADEAGDEAGEDEGEDGVMMVCCCFVIFVISICVMILCLWRLRGDMKSIRRRIKRRFTRGIFEIIGTTKANVCEMICVCLWRC